MIIFIDNQSDFELVYAVGTKIKYNGREYSGIESVELHSISHILFDAIGARHIRRNAVYKVTDGTLVQVTNFSIDIRGHLLIASFFGNKVIGGWYPKVITVPGIGNVEIAEVPGAFRSLLMRVQ